MQDKDAIIKSIVKGFAYAENGGKPDISNPVAGKTGEMKSIFQFTPDTWKKDSSQVFGKETEMTPDNETYVMMHKVSKWLDEGKTVSQMASIHNAGAGEPDAYTGKFSDGTSSVGVNKKYGVKFNVPAYAKKVVNYSKEFYMSQSGNMQGTATGNIPTQENMQQPQTQGLLQGQTQKRPKLVTAGSPLLRDI